MKKLTVVFIFLYTVFVYGQQLPKGFVYVSEIDPSIQQELRYISNNNFIGSPIDGYEKDVVIVTQPTAKALKKVQQVLLKKQLSLKIYDAYRPQRAVDHFVRWAKVLQDTIQKHEYYPDVPKSELFKQGFIASRSGHTRGSTVDLTIVDLKTGKELDMGSPYDFFGEESHPFYSKLTKEQRKNRLYLRKIMLQHGFSPYDNEWWHFTLKNEPFPNTYFDFPIK